MNPFEVLREFYPTQSKVYTVLVKHGHQVAGKALEAARRVPHLKPDMTFIQEAALLHDIGIGLTGVKRWQCQGQHPYICHGILGRMLLEQCQLPRHALICERHIGVGLRAQDIRNQKLPLPARDMTPISIEEQIICYADNFFSKSANGSAAPKSIAEIRHELSRFGNCHVQRFDQWVQLFHC
jgi:uncharacterized protein